jgi:quinolinate synthase
MDVELQGVLTSVLKDQQKSSGNKQPMVAIADSLAMGDDAVKMCQEGAKAIACLGVDFMSESVATIMARNGFGHIPVYRLDAAPIGCSLAESAERESYRAWLETAGKDESALHVVYINTSLETKAVSNSIVPTITCTSSNVLQTILQASSQIPDIKIMYGPDTYMGNNLITMLDAILKHGEGGGADGEEPWDNVRIARDLHPGHNTASLRKLRDSIDVYPAGNCVVHHMFGAEVSAAVRRNYDDAYVSAHLEVPGEMFEIAMEKSLAGKGVVGSTADILKFISQKVTEAAEKDGAELHRLKFILGTEAGMVTSIVKSVRDILERTGSDRVECEIVFPVASDAFMTTDEAGSQSTDGLAIVPGVGGGEGCSTAGGCATCPFMKMNDLNSLIDVIDMVGANQKQGGAGDEAKILNEFLPPNRIQGRTINGVSAVDLGSQPILYMRQFMKEKSIPEELVQRITA